MKYKAEILTQPLIYKFQFYFTKFVYFELITTIKIYKLQRYWIVKIQNTTLKENNILYLFLWNIRQQYENRTEQ